jgi:hypothetical protein
MGKDRRRKRRKGGSLPRFDSGKCKGKSLPSARQHTGPLSRDGLAPAVANERAGKPLSIASLMEPRTEAPTEASTGLKVNRRAGCEGAWLDLLSSFAAAILIRGRESKSPQTRRQTKRPPIPNPQASNPFFSLPASPASLSH